MGNKIALLTWVAILAFSLFVLAEGRGILIPIAVAVVIWYLLNALAKRFARISIAGQRLPFWLCLACAGITALAVILVVVEVAATGVSGLVGAAPQYQENLEKLVIRLSAGLGFDDVPTTAEIVEKVDFQSVAGFLAGSAASFASNLIIVLCYVAFLMLEQQNFDSKLRALVPDDERRANISSILGRIQAEIQTYVWIKFLMGLLAGGVALVVLLSVGLDSAALWAFIVFLLSFIPTIGTILGFLFPAFLALLQFETLTPFLIVLATLGPAQILLNNVVEPRFMGSSLNLSPLVIFAGLALWATLWGITGAVLSVPVLVISTIVLAHFPSTRPIAVLLTRDGQVK